MKDLINHPAVKDKLNEQADVLKGINLEVPGQIRFTKDPLTLAKLEFNDKI